MDHTVLITVHAVAATTAFVAGAIALPAGRLFALYRWAQVLMVAALAGAVWVAFPGYAGAQRVAFPALLVLALAMLVRAELARRVRPAVTGATTTGYVGHVGFTLIALADGFAIVAALRAGAPGWLVAVLAVAVVLVGLGAIRAATVRWVDAAPPPAHTAMPAAQPTPGRVSRKRAPGVPGT